MVVGHLVRAAGIGSTPDPRMHAAGQVLVQVHAASANPADWRLLRAAPFLVRLMGNGLLKPKHQVLGADVAGAVEAVGAGVTQFRPGDEVFGENPDCGGFAEYVCVPADRLAPKPANLSFEQAAAVPMAAGHCPAWPARRGAATARVESAGQRRVRRRRDRRLKHQKPGTCALNRRRPRNRLHPGRLHAR